jgi:hypothetical protein
MFLPDFEVATLQVKSTAIVVVIVIVVVVVDDVVVDDVTYRLRLRPLLSFFLFQTFFLFLP